MRDVASWLYLIFVVGGILLVVGTAAWASVRAAPWVPTRRRDVDRLVSLLRIKPGHTVYDLGAGDARLVEHIARQYQAKAIGIELSLLPFLYAKVRQWLYRGPGSISITYGDFFRRDLSEADAVVCFLTPMAMKKLSPKFRRELKAGARVASYAFEIPDWPAIEHNKPEPKLTTIHVYQK